MYHIAVQSALSCLEAMDIFCAACPPVGLERILHCQGGRRCGGKLCDLLFRSIINVWPSRAKLTPARTGMAYSTSTRLCRERRLAHRANHAKPPHHNLLFLVLSHVFESETDPLRGQLCYSSGVEDKPNVVVPERPVRAVQP